MLEFQNQYKVVEKIHKNYLGFGSIEYEILFENMMVISSNHGPSADKICAALNGAFNLGVMQNGFQND